MSVVGKIVDGTNSGYIAKVTENNQLVTAPLKYDEVKFNSLAEADTAYNFYTPKAGEQFVITGIIASGTLAIAANALATAVIYEATTDSTTTVSKTLLQFGITRLESVAFLPLNILVNEGVYVNAKTDDDDVETTITGYYINKLT